MNHHLRLLMIAVLMATCCGVSLPALGQVQSPQSATANQPYSASRGLQNALNRVFEKGNLMVALSAVDWRPGLAMAATKLPVGAAATLELRLKRGANYAVIGTADDELTDVDLYLLDSLGNILTKDQEADGTPILEFQVPTTGNYQVQLHVAAANTEVNYVALSLLQSAGQPIIEGDYRIAGNRFFTSAEALFGTTDNLSWQNSSGGWSVLGFTVRNDKPFNLRNWRLPANLKFKVAASTDGQFRNLSLYLADSNGKIVAQSSGKSRFPLLEFQTSLQQPYLLRIAPKGARVNGLLLLGVFQH